MNGMNCSNTCNDYTMLDIIYYTLPRDYNMYNKCKMKYTCYGTVLLSLISRVSGSIWSSGYCLTEYLVEFF